MFYGEPIDLDERKKSSCSKRSKFYSFSDRGQTWVTKHCQPNT